MAKHKGATFGLLARANGDHSRTSAANGATSPQQFVFEAAVVQECWVGRSRDRIPCPRCRRRSIESAIAHVYQIRRTPNIFDRFDRRLIAYGPTHGQIGTRS